MRTTIPGLHRVSSLNILRRDGYWITNEGDDIKATKPFGKKRYPRFHLKISGDNEKAPPQLDLHIDWERPKHSQYWGKCSTEDDDAIRLEMERPKGLLSNF